MTEVSGALGSAGNSKPRSCCAIGPDGSAVRKIKIDESSSRCSRLATPTRSRSAIRPLANRIRSASARRDAGIVSALALTHIGINDYGFYPDRRRDPPGQFGGAPGSIFPAPRRHQPAIYRARAAAWVSASRFRQHCSKASSSSARRGGATVQTAVLGEPAGYLQGHRESARSGSPPGALVVSSRPALRPPTRPEARRRSSCDRRNNRWTTPEGSARLGSSRWAAVASLALLRAGKNLVAPLNSHRGAGDAARDTILIRLSPFQGPEVDEPSPAVVRTSRCKRPGMRQRWRHRNGRRAYSIAAKLSFQTDDSLRVNGATLKRRATWKKRRRTRAVFDDDLPRRTVVRARLLLRRRCSARHAERARAAA